jgi:putative DNA primase/helicase
VEPEIKARARGRWQGILAAIGIHREQLQNKHGPCPLCGGKDRFRFDDLQGDGTWICNRCGSGDGFSLVRKLKGVDFLGAVELIEREIGAAPVRLPKPTQEDPGRRDRLQSIWTHAVPLSGPDTASRYLASRGITIKPPANAVRFVADLPYYDGKIRAYFPTMIAKVVAPDNSAATLHRTYLDKSGTKAFVLGDKCKMLFPGKIPVGGAVRLGPVQGRMGVAEGIETALSAAQLFGISVWACLSAAALMKWEPPPGVRQIVIFGDRDDSFCGQMTSYSLAYRLKTMYRSLTEIEVHFPAGNFGDFNDQLCAAGH